MTEREYIDATNLAKVRMARAIMREYTPNGGRPDGLIAEAYETLVQAEEALMPFVKTTATRRGR